MDKGKEKAIEQRFNCYIEMLKNVYSVDEYGLADIIGLRHCEWARRRNKGWKEYSVKMIKGLADLTGVSVDWLMMLEWSEGRNLEGSQA